MFGAFKQRVASSGLLSRKCFNVGERLASCQSQNISACYNEVNQNSKFVMPGSPLECKLPMMMRALSSRTFGKDFMHSYKTNTSSPPVDDKNQGGHLQKHFMSFHTTGNSFLIGIKTLSDINNFSSGKMASSISTRSPHSSMSKCQPVHTEATQADSAATNVNINRPLSPHLSVYRPQLNSTLSIFHRITGAFLAGVVLSGVLLFEIGQTSLTFESIYQLSQSPIFPLVALILPNLVIVALLYHATTGIRHLIYDWRAGAKFFKRP